MSIMCMPVMLTTWVGGSAKRILTSDQLFKFDIVYDLLLHL